MRTHCTQSVLFFLALMTGTLLLSSCQREQRDYRVATAASSTQDGSQLSQLSPGAPMTQQQSPTNAAVSALVDPYEHNAYAVAEGERLYSYFNCVGCHAHGAGGIGPALMDNAWVYGSTPRDIYVSIIQGRPNGMPSFRGKISEQQVWELVAYVRSMSGQLKKDVAPGRSDHMSMGKPPQSTKPEHPTPPMGNAGEAHK